MNDKTLMRLSLVIAIVGLAALMVAANFAEPKKVEISSIGEEMIGHNVKVNGSVESASINDGNIFISLADGNSSIDIVMFKQNAKNNAVAYNLKKGDFIIVEGKVNFYRNDLEIVADSLKRI